MLAMTRVNSLFWRGLLLIVFCLAGQAHAAKFTSDDVKTIVSKNTSVLVDDFNREKKHYDENPEQFYKVMDQSLGILVDFNRIAARVMGKYARRASKDQRQKFTETFKQSLYRTYSKVLIDSGANAIDVHDAALNSRSDERASVNLEVVTDTGKRYPVIYSMYLNNQDQWLMENVIVFGVNIGLAFKDRFESEYRSRKGDIDAVIANWASKLDIATDK